MQQKIQIISCVLFLVALAIGSTGCGKTMPSDLKHDIQSMIALLEKGDNEAFVEQFGWEYNAYTGDKNPKEILTGYAVQVENERLIKNLKSVLALEPHEYTSNDGKELIEFRVDDEFIMDMPIYFYKDSNLPNWTVNL